jgi:hypothetical protein
MSTRHDGTGSHARSLPPPLNHIIRSQQTQKFRISVLSFLFIEMIHSNDWPMNCILVSMQDKSIDTSLRPTDRPDRVTIHNLAHKCAVMIFGHRTVKSGH